MSFSQVCMTVHSILRIFLMGLSSSFFPLFSFRHVDQSQPCAYSYCMFVRSHPSSCFQTRLPHATCVTIRQCSSLHSLSYFPVESPPFLGLHYCLFSRPILQSYFLHLTPRMRRRIHPALIDHPCPLHVSCLATRWKGSLWFSSSCFPSVLLFALLRLLLFSAFTVVVLLFFFFFFHAAVSMLCWFMCGVVCMLVHHFITFVSVLSASFLYFFYAAGR